MGRQDEEVDDEKEQGDEVMLEEVKAREIITNLEDVILRKEAEVEEFGEGLVAVEEKNKYKDANWEVVKEKEDEFFLKNKKDCMLVEGMKLVDCNEDAGGFDEEM